MRFLLAKGRKPGGGGLGGGRTKQPYWPFREISQNFVGFLWWRVEGERRERCIRTYRCRCSPDVCFGSRIDTGTVEKFLRIVFPLGGGKGVLSRTCCPCGYQVANQLERPEVTPMACCCPQPSGGSLFEAMPLVLLVLVLLMLVLLLRRSNCAR